MNKSNECCEILVKIVLDLIYFNDNSKRFSLLVLSFATGNNFSFTVLRDIKSSKYLSLKCPSNN